MSDMLHILLLLIYSNSLRSLKVLGTTSLLDYCSIIVISIITITIGMVVYYFSLLLKYYTTIGLWITYPCTGNIAQMKVWMGSWWCVPLSSDTLIIPVCSAGGVRNTVFSSSWVTENICAYVLLSNFNIMLFSVSIVLVVCKSTWW